MEDIADKTKENGYNLNFTANLKLYKDILSIKGIYGMNQENMRRFHFYTFRCLLTNECTNQEETYNLKDG